MSTDVAERLSDISDIPGILADVADCCTSGTSSTDVVEKLSTYESDSGAICCCTTVSTDVAERLSDISDIPGIFVDVADPKTSNSFPPFCFCVFDGIKTDVSNPHPHPPSKILFSPHPHPPPFCFLNVIISCNTFISLSETVEYISLALTVEDS